MFAIFLPIFSPYNVVLYTQGSFPAQACCINAVTWKPLSLKFNLKYLWLFNLNYFVCLKEQKKQPVSLSGKQLFLTCKAKCYFNLHHRKAFLTDEERRLSIPTITKMSFAIMSMERKWPILTNSCISVQDILWPCHGMLCNHVNYKLKN